MEWLEGAIPLAQQYRKKTEELSDDDDILLAIMIEVGIGERASGGPCTGGSASAWGLERPIAISQKHPEHVFCSCSFASIEDRQIGLPVAVEIRCHDRLQKIPDVVVQRGGKCAVAFAEQNRYAARSGIAPGEKH